MYKREREDRKRGGDGLQGDIERGNMGISPCKDTTLQIEYQFPPISIAGCIMYCIIRLGSEKGQCLPTNNRFGL